MDTDCHLSGYANKRMENSLVTSTIYTESLTFSQLDCEALYCIAKLRQDVFIIEQRSIYIDLDGFDQDACHVLIWMDGKTGKELAAYARLRTLTDKESYKIERVVCAKVYRGQGLAKRLMDELMLKISEEADYSKVTLSSQLSVCSFYHRWGFAETGECYDDGGIEHIDMIARL